MTATKPIDLAPTAGPPMLASATHQLNVCNACRYCEGLCAVFPALARRTTLDQGDVSQLANLCHDCRACFDACMYAPPHEFGINLPAALGSVRLEDYRRYSWPARMPKGLRGLGGALLMACLAISIMLGLAIAHTGVSGLVRSPAGTESPYALIPHVTLLLVMGIPAVYALAVIVRGGKLFWREIGGAPSGLSWRASWASLVQAATLRYQRGGGVGCYYPEDEVPSSSRRQLHGFVAYGFGLCLVSTAAAAVQQNLLGQWPPYGWLSVPVISGTAGGALMFVGCIGLLVLKRQSSNVTTSPQAKESEYHLLVALAFLGASGLATLLTRTTSVYGIVLLIHLASVAMAFAAAPYTRFAHVTYRSLALLRDNLEIAA